MDSTFKDRVKSSCDIVRVIGEYTPLQRLGSTMRYRANCPFHSEKTPSFYVNADQQFYHCFGCGKGGDVFSFVMEMTSVSFFEALKMLAEQHGIPVPKQREDNDPASRLRASVQDLHDIAAKYFQELLFSAGGDSARQYIKRRGLTKELTEEFGLGLSDATGGLTRLFQRQGVPENLLEESGLSARRQEGPGFYDRFRGRLMFPIHNESGKVIGFGARALGEEQPKYLNSPETSLYTKKLVLYNLHRAKPSARRSGRIVLVEGYMDAIGAHAAGVFEVVASCGTALSGDQVRAMKRQADRVVVNYDADKAGENAAERGIQLLLEESMQVRMCSLSGGLDPDEYVKQHGAEAYQRALDTSPGYFHWLADRARVRFDMRSAEGRVEAFRFLLPAIQKLPDKLERLGVVNDVAAQLGVDAGVVLDQFRKAASERKPPKAIAITAADGLPDSEKLLVRLILHHPAALSAYSDTILGMESLPALRSFKIIETALNLIEGHGSIDFAALQARLPEEDAHLLAALFSSDTEGVERHHEDPTVQLRACLDKLTRDYEQQRRKQLRVQVREAEQRGDIAEALRLMEIERNLERNTKPSR